jgi:putative transposase
MARLARVIGLDLPHHVTQRGNQRRFILDNDTHRSIYLDLLAQSLALHGVALIGYCLMSNHVHLVLVPRKPESLGLALKHSHGRFASYWNAVHRSSGHVWQGRYYSCPLDETHLWEALRYTELNPVRAGLIEEAGSWKWSSAAAHCATASAEACFSDGIVENAMVCRILARISGSTGK